MPKNARKHLMSGSARQIKTENALECSGGESAGKVEPKNALKEIRVIPAHYPLRGRQSVTPILVTGFKQAA